MRKLISYIISTGDVNMDRDAVIDCISEEDFNKVLNVGIGDGYEECIPLTQFSNFSGAIFGADNALIGWKGQGFPMGI